MEIESEWKARKRERGAGRVCPAVERPIQAKGGLEGPTDPPVPARNVFGTVGLFRLLFVATSSRTGVSAPQVNPKRKVPPTTLGAGPDCGRDDRPGRVSQVFTTNLVRPTLEVGGLLTSPKQLRAAGEYDDQGSQTDAVKPSPQDRAEERQLDTHCR